MAKLAAQHPNADTALHFSNAYELLVATILSAQCTDERVNQVTPALFKRYPTPRALAMATTDELEPQIQSTGFFRAKSRALHGMANAIVQDFDGDVPRTKDELVTLPGVGRKTANVVLGHALGVPGLPVDRHVLRVANRIGIARSEDPEVVERQLCAAMPAPKWTNTSAVRKDCDYYREVVSRSGPNRSESGSLVVVRRAPKARGTGRGGGAPRQAKK
jgi:endonuclease-3